MVKFLQRVGEIIRGETPIEGAQRRAANRDIKMISRAAAFKAKREEAIKFAQSRQRLLREARERQLKRRLAPRPEFGSPFSQPQTGVVATRSRKGKRRKRTIQKQSPRFNFVSGTIGNSSREKFDVLGF